MAILENKVKKTILLLHTFLIQISLVYKKGFLFKKESEASFG